MWKSHCYQIMKFPTKEPTLKGDLDNPILTGPINEPGNSNMNHRYRKPTIRLVLEVLGLLGTKNLQNGINRHFKIKK